MRTRLHGLIPAAALILSACQVDQLLNSPGDGGAPPPPPPPSALSPNSPSSLGQYRLDGSPIGSGATIGDNSIEIRAMVTDPEADDSIRLQLELRFDGSTFTGSPTHLSARVAPGAFATIRIEHALSDTTYQWRVRAVDRAGRVSDWVPYSAGASFRVAVTRLPLPPAGLQQYEADGRTEIPAGGTVEDRDVFLEAAVDDARMTGKARVEFEVRPREAAFSGRRTHWKDDIENGERARVKFRAAAFVAYHWQARVCHGEVCSAWAEFGGNGPEAADFYRDPFDGDDIIDD